MEDVQLIAEKLARVLRTVSHQTRDKAIRKAMRILKSEKVGPKHCVRCGNLIPGKVFRADRIYCGASCKVMACRERSGRDE